MTFRWGDILDEDEATLSRAELSRIPSFRDMPKGAGFQVLDDNFPEAFVRNSGAWIELEIRDHIYTKYWEHKFHARVFAKAMVRAVRRLAESNG